jgi:hypothetical protein
MTLKLTIAIKVAMVENEVKNEVKYDDSKGNTTTGVLDMGTHSVINVGDPEVDSGAINKGYLTNGLSNMKRHADKEIKRVIRKIPSANM